MASREFHGRLHNRWTDDLFWVDANVDGGTWQDPWLPSEKAAVIHPGEIAEWRSESDGFMTGTSGWSLWRTTVGNHDEWITVGWDVPFLGKPDISATVQGFDPRIRGNVFIEGGPPTLIVGQEGFDRGGGRGSIVDLVSYTVFVPVSWFADDAMVTHPTVQFGVLMPAATPGTKPQDFDTTPHDFSPQPMTGFAPTSWRGTWTDAPEGRDSTRVGLTVDAQGFVSVEITEKSAELFVRPFRKVVTGLQIVQRQSDPYKGNIRASRTPALAINVVDQGDQPVALRPGLREIATLHVGAGAVDPGAEGPGHFNFDPAHGHGITVDSIVVDDSISLELFRNFSEEGVPGLPRLRYRSVDSNGRVRKDLMLNRIDVIK